MSARHNVLVAKIVDTDNFDSDYPDEKFLLWPMSHRAAEAICEVINREAGEHSSRFYKVVENDYVLRPGFEP